MLDQLNDGSHEITLHNIACPDCPVYPNSTGLLKWAPETGIRYSFTFAGTRSLDPPYRVSPQQQSLGVGRLREANLAHPAWVADTDDGTRVQLYEVNENWSSSQTTGTSGFSTSCRFEGTAIYAVVELPTSRLLAFDNSTEENYRMFFIGEAGGRHHKTEDVSFVDRDGTTRDTKRCSVTLSESPRIALVSGHSLIKSQPSGWLAFEHAPATSDCEIPAAAERNFVSFINGHVVPFFWADRRIAVNKIRRTYFGWVKVPRHHRGEILYQPLPFMNGVEVFTHGDEVLSHISNLFQSFVAKSALLDFGSMLWPLWTALASVLQDRLALASVSLERTASIWDACRTEVLNESLADDPSVWKKKPLLKSLRKSLAEQLGAFVTSDACKDLTQPEKEELQKVVVARIDNFTPIPNSARLRRPFDDLEIPLSHEEIEAIQQRNSALHGRLGEDKVGFKNLDITVEYFDRLRVLITKFVLKLSGYQGPYIDYASRPAVGNFEVKKL